MTGNEVFVILPRHAESVVPVRLGELTGTALVLEDSFHPELMQNELLYRVTSPEGGEVIGIGTYMRFSKSEDEFVRQLSFEEPFLRDELVGSYLSDKARSQRSAELWHKAVESVLMTQLTPHVGIVHTVSAFGAESRIHFSGRDDYALSDADAFLFMKLPPDRIAVFRSTYGI